MATTTNYGWTTPDDTALVKDGASAIRTLGTAIDTTTFNNAAAAIAKTIVDAKGDIIAATAADTVARLAVGANDTVLTADSSTATGLKWATPAAGGMTLISTTSLTGSSVTISSIPSGYNSIKLYMRNARPSADVALYVRMNAITTNSYIQHRTDSNNDGTQSTSFSGDSWYLGTQDSATSQSSMVFEFDDYTNTTTWKIGKFYGFANNTTTNTNSSPANKILANNTTNALTSLTFYPDTGTWSAGEILMYGVK